MDLLQTIFFMLVALGILVTFHEFGHFWVARRCGIKVLRFSVGFGTPLFRWHDRLGTEFVIAALPLGGYVKMVDEREGNVATEDLPYAFTQKTVWQRMAVVIAGPMANFALAVLAYWLIYSLGVTGMAPIVDSVAPGSVAERAGLQRGQEIVAVDGKPTPIWQALNEQLVGRIGESGAISFTVKLRDETQTYDYQGQLETWLMEADQPDPIGGLGLTLYTPPILPVAGNVIGGDPADQAGLVAGDRILKADGIVMDDWISWVDYVRARPSVAIELSVQRDDEVFTTSLVPRQVDDEDGNPIGQVGMAVQMPDWPEEMIRKTNYSLFGALGRGVEQTWNMSVLILDSVKKMLTGLISSKHLSGPITIAKVAGASAQYGFTAYLGFLAFLSVSLGVLNLLPIPVLDGGHLMYYVIEAIKGKPVSEKIQIVGFRIGMFLVIGLMLLALYNDLMRL
ncbi:RIP metalloprotease RseP [Porticoccus sp.]|uniref:RIP metalloprotease RseP n=1 Tax=Porticoccus sp. TaxID=2024853 RepID=UPI003F69E2D0